jgi:hypothetical protein
VGVSFTGVRPEISTGTVETAVPWPGVFILQGFQQTGTLQNVAVSYLGVSFGTNHILEMGVVNLAGGSVDVDYIISYYTI